MVILMIMIILVWGFLSDDTYNNNNIITIFYLFIYLFAFIFMVVWYLNDFTNPTHINV